MRHLGTVRARLAALLLAGAALTATPAYAETVSMNGTVVDAETGQPVSGVCVLLWKEEGNYAWEQYPEECTGDDGTWSKAGLEPGVYYVEAAGAGYVKQYAYEQEHSWDATRWTLGDGDSATVDLAMQPGGTIEGTVTDSQTGLPVSGLCVSTQGEGTFASSCTDEEGRYALGGLRPGSDYRLYFVDWDYGRYAFEYAHDAAGYDTATTFTVEAWQVTTVDEDVDPAASLSGRVTDQTTGEPLANVCVNAMPDPDGWDSGGYACTDGDGTYRIAPVQPGTYHLSVEDDSGAHPRTMHPSATSSDASVPVTVAPGEAATGADVAMPAAAYLSGTVVRASTGEPVAGVCAAAVTVSDRRWLRSGGPGMCSDESGRYTLGGMPTGDVKVAFYPPDSDLLMRWYGSETEDGATPVSVTSGETTNGVDVAMQQSGRITGRVTDGKTKKPIEGVCVTVGVFSHRSGENGTPHSPACTGADGRYTLDGLPTGSYQVEFYSPEGEWASQFFPNKPDRVNAAKVAVTAGGPAAEANAKMVRGGTIQGTILDPVTGGPAEGVCLDAYTSRRPDPIGTTYCTLADGKYVMRGFPTGSVKIQLSYGGGPYTTSWIHTGTAFETATVIPTTAGLTTTVDATAVRQP